MGTGFAAGEEQWRARLGTLRQVVRQEIVAQQLAVHLPDVPPRRILDVGCGQGTQVLSLARRGHLVTGLDSSSTLLGDLDRALSDERPEVRERAHLVHGDAERALELFAPASFDAVLCHRVLMYFTDPDPLLDAIDDAHMQDPEQLSLVSACEDRAEGTDPYRWVAALLQVIAAST